ncbi:hypothetical protein M9H77_06395 [Catharanthus roseus]|uniref:Uncharacterized protein n=1 Tax=Catharanthus roseus TaxID=4058 RepID=A0ACC0BRZ2_CATRO|nr:hypothetical protein M9H77_06395 [Catharanthus roseus]
MISFEQFSEHRRASIPIACRGVHHVDTSRGRSVKQQRFHIKQSKTLSHDAFSVFDNHQKKTGPFPDLCFPKCTRLRSWYFCKRLQECLLISIAAAFEEYLESAASNNLLGLSGRGLVLVDHIRVQKKREIVKAEFIQYMQKLVRTAVLIRSSVPVVSGSFFAHPYDLSFTRRLSRILARRAFFQLLFSLTLEARPFEVRIDCPRSGAI